MLLILFPEEAWARDSVQSQGSSGHLDGGTIALPLCSHFTALLTLRNQAVSLGGIPSLPSYHQTLFITSSETGFSHFLPGGSFPKLTSRNPAPLCVTWGIILRYYVELMSFVIFLFSSFVIFMPISRVGCARVL